MTLNQDKKFEIIENLKVSFFIIISIILCFIILISVITYNIVSTGGPNISTFLGIIWTISIIFIIFVLWYSRNLTKLRFFIINKNEIKIFLPNRPEFQIFWTELNLVQIKKYGRGKSLIYEIIFETEGTSRNFRYVPGRDFRVRSNKKILIALESWCGKKGKDFSGYIQ